MNIMSQILFICTKFDAQNYGNKYSQRSCYAAEQHKKCIFQ